MKGKLQLLGIGAAMVLAVVVPSHAVASKPNTLAIRSQSAIYHPTTGRVTFRIVFNRSPDLSIADDLGRQADDFQYFVGSGVPVAPMLETYEFGNWTGVHIVGYIVIRR
jgi:hypothetical protein